MTIFGMSGWNSWAVPNSIRDDKCSSVSLVLWQVFVDFMKENNCSHTYYVEPNIAIILVANFLKFVNLSGRYEKKPGIPTSRYFALSVESDCISNGSICRLSSALATSNVNGAENNAVFFKRGEIKKSFLKFFWEQFQVTLILSKTKYRLSIGSVFQLFALRKMNQIFIPVSVAKLQFSTSTHHFKNPQIKQKIPKLQCPCVGCRRAWKGPHAARGPRVWHYWAIGNRSCVSSNAL